MLSQGIPKAEFGVLWTPSTVWSNILGGEHSVSSTDTFGSQWMRIPVPIPGTFRNLRLYSGDTRGFDTTLTVYKNNAASSLAATMAAGNPFGDDTTHNLTVIAGDDICGRYSGTSTFGPPGMHTGLCVIFDGNEAIYGISATAGTIAVDSGWYGGILGNGRFESTVGPPPDGLINLSQTYSICGAPGTIDHLCLKEIASIAVGGGWEAWLRLNGVLQDGSGGTVDTTTTLADGGIFTVNSGFALPIVLGDLVELVVLRTGTSAPFTTGHVAASIAATPTNAGEFMFCGGNNNAISAVADGYEWNEGGQLVTPEALTQAPMLLDFLLTGLIIRTVDPKTIGSTLTGIARVNSANTAASVTITPGNIAGSIGGLSIPVASGSLLSMLIDPVNTPSAGNFHWGIAAIAAGTLVVQKSAPADPAQAFTIDVGPGLIPASYALHDGESQSIAVAAGTYSVDETPPTGWVTPSFNVSTGDPHTAVVIAAGQTATVTVINTPEAGCPGLITTPTTDGAPYTPFTPNPCAGDGNVTVPRTDGLPYVPFTS